MKTNVNIIGLKETIKRFEQFGQKGRDAVEELVDSAAFSTADFAKKRVRNNGAFDRGSLAQGIYVRKISAMNVDVISSADHSGYVEFGTGAQVEVPAALQAQASLIRQRPRKTGALQAIKEWCKRKGIDEKAAWPILMAILNRGLRPRPFMYPALLYARRKVRTESKIMLKQLKDNF